MAGGQQSKRGGNRRKIAADLAATPLGRALWLVWAMSVLWVACFDPFGLDSRVESMTDSVAQRLFAGRYPDAAARHIALIQVGAADLDHPSLELGFPLSSQVQAQIVRVLIAARARAIFIDSEFRNPARPPRDSAEDLFAEPDASVPASGGHDALVEAIAAARSAGIPVVTGPIGSRADLSSLKRVAIEAGVSWNADHPGDYSLRSDDRDIAAASLYRLVCAGTAPLPGCASGLLQRIERGDARPMVLRFGGSYPAEQWRFSGSAEGVGCRTRTMLATLRRELLGRDAEPPCTHHLVIPVSWMLLAQNQFGELAAMLEGRVVMIGAGAGMGDDHVVPGVGKLPGVAIHAMALDNLLSWGGAYPRWPEDFADGPKIGLDELLKLFALLVLPWLLSRAAAHLCRTRATHREIALRTAAVAFAGSVMLVAVAMLCVVAFAWPISVALTLAGLSTVVAGILSGPDFHHALQPFSGRRSAIALLAVLGVAGIALIAPYLLLLLPLAALVLGALQLHRWLAFRAAAPLDDQPENAT
ncbi:CHASE2 domain-containing protein [Sphingomonas sp. LM7]|uniref:CHASE2 domain-containing protein n=1 Tax=Sphingomonas sp. LM7 TaxID=1938607 RepID=UPI000984069D|nr:CHASE2 domain-containing protein [Sphingomonas sp. LM7]AQR73554.1 hypothetical protein BXU08_07785 [Sphingomonas sp. LM7]